MIDIRRFTLLLCVALLLALSGGGLHANAETVRSVGYAVSAVLPSNQIEGSSGYFDLLVKPGQTQVLQVRILNREDKEIAVAVEANTAYTNNNGIIEYAKHEQTDESLKVDFSQLVTVLEQRMDAQEDKNFTSLLTDSLVSEDAVIYMVPANGEVTAEFKLNVPDEAFEGTLLGGLMFTMLDQKNEQDSGGMAVNSIYRYAIAVYVRESMNGLTPSFDMTEVSVGQMRTPALQLHLRNPVARIVHGVKLKGAVYPADGSEEVFSFERDGIRMAPNTAMNYSVAFKEGQMLPSGEYKVLVELSYQEELWNFELPLLVQ